jgi:hypothetical protein
LRSVQRTIANKGSGYGQQNNMNSTFYNQQSVSSDPRTTESTSEGRGDDFARVTHFDKSAAFGFSDDKLGRLAEINR